MTELLRYQGSVAPLSLVLALSALGVLDAAGIEPIGFRKDGSPIWPMAGGASAAAEREAAIADFQAADELVSGDDGPSPENKDRFDALFTSGKAHMEAYRQLSATEGNVKTTRQMLGELTQQIRGGDPVPFVPIAKGNLRPKSAGDLFNESDEMTALRESGKLANDFSRAPIGESGRVKIGAAATDVINTGSGQGGTALVTPQYLPGILPLPQRPLTIRNLFSQDTTQSDTLSYARQTSLDNAAAPVAQATSLTTGLKPQSSIGWQRVTTPIESIATWMAATRRQLADAGQTRSLIDNQLSLMLDLAEEDQLLNGNGSSPNIRGLLQTSGVQTLDLTGVAHGAGTHVNIDGIRDAIRLVKTGPAFATPDGIAMHPFDSAALDEAKDNQGRYLGQGPFGQALDTIWRLPRVESLALSQGHAIVGAFKQGATIFQREEDAIYTSDSHSDFFIRNLIAVLIEERLGLAVFFPPAFCYVTFGATNGWTGA